MNYFELTIDFKNQSTGMDDEELSEILIAELAELGFDSFTYDNQILSAYKNDEANFDLITDLVSKYDLSFQWNEMDKKNWNEVWESNFEPVLIDKRVYIKADFHPDYHGAEFTIHIQPKMSFGTGHHSTTELMVKEILNYRFDGKSVIDIGAGTGILAILAFKKGASPIAATEIEEFALENCKENLLKNGLNKFRIFDFNLQKDNYGKYDFIFANINRNVHLGQCHLYAQSIHPGGIIIISGFYTSDNHDIEQNFKKFGFSCIGTDSLNNWSRMTFRKES